VIAPGRTFTNWAGDEVCAPRNVRRARDAGEVRDALQAADAEGARLRVLGAAHSPSDIAMSDEHLTTLDGMDRVLAIDPEAQTVRVQGGTRLATLNAALAARGLALPILGSISDQTVAGAVATATHGTGLGHGVLSTLVTELELVAPAGETLRASADQAPDLLRAARCSLGALGVVTELTLRVAPAFDLIVDEAPSTLDAVLAALPERLAIDHYRFWYLPHAETAWEWKAARAPREPAAAFQHPAESPLRRLWRERVVGYHGFESLLYLGTLRPEIIPDVNRWFARKMFATPRRSRERSDRQFNFDCLFRQRVNEWAIPIECTADALRGLRDLIARRGLRVHLPIEVRFARGDDAWLSPCHGRDSCYVGVIAYRPFGRPHPGTDEYFAAYEELMASFGGRPHWAKRFGPGPRELAALYPRWDDFQRMRTRLDPRGMLANAYTDRVLGPVRVAAAPVDSL
jgi:L-gulonolactone oxidase